MSRFPVSFPLLVTVVATVTPAALAGAGSGPVVPRAVQARITHEAPALAYAPTRMALGFHYLSWQKTPSTVRITFGDRAGWEIRFAALPLTGACRTGMEKSFQLDGNKVYWSRTGTRQQAWRCVAGPNGRQIRLVASSPQPPTRFADVGLGRVVASGKRISV
jgi:hypothetical protein